MNQNHSSILLGVNEEKETKKEVRLFSVVSGGCGGRRGAWEEDLVEDSGNLGRKGNEKEKMVVDQEWYVSRYIRRACRIKV